MSTDKRPCPSCADTRAISIERGGKVYTHGCPRCLPSPPPTGPRVGDPCGPDCPVGGVLIRKGNIGQKRSNTLVCRKPYRQGHALGCGREVQRG